MMAAQLETPGDVAIGAFVLVALLALAVAIAASRRLKTRSDYYTAGGAIGSGRNALALAGDFISAGGFLGLTGLIAQHGVDAALYAVGVIAAWPLMLLLFAGPLKQLGRYTLADVLVARLGSERLRIMTASNQLVIILLGLTSNLVGALVILRLLFGLEAIGALLAIGVILLAYVVIGGMLAATWLQVIKAVLLMVTAALLLVLCLAQFHFNADALLRLVVARQGPGMLAPGSMYTSSVEIASLLLGLAFGGASMPHVLMRMNTVADPASARRSAFMATAIVVVFHVALVFLGLAAGALSPSLPEGVDKGGNLALPLLARVLGGDALLGVTAAIAFTTLLAVMAGQCIAGSAALSHDIWERLCPGRGAPGLRGSRVASCVLLAAALAVAYGLRGQNIGYIAAAGLSIAACANFPTLTLTLFWRRLTAAGAVAGMATGLTASLLLIALSPLVQVNLLGRAQAPFPLSYPTLVAAPLSLLAAVLVSLLTRRNGGKSKEVSALRASLTLAAVVPLGLLALAASVVGARHVLSAQLAGQTTAYCAVLLGSAAVILLIAWLDYRGTRAAARLP